MVYQLLQVQTDNYAVHTVHSCVSQRHNVSNSPLNFLFKIHDQLCKRCSRYFPGESECCGIRRVCVSSNLVHLAQRMTMDAY